MTDSSQMSTGTRYTMTVALLLVAFVVCPVVLFASRPMGYLSVSSAMLASLLFMTLAWVNSRKNAELTIPSIVPISPRKR